MFSTWRLLSRILLTEGGSNTGYFYLRGYGTLDATSGSSGESIEKSLGTTWVLFDTWTMYGAAMKRARDTTDGVPDLSAHPSPFTSPTISFHVVK